MSFFAGKGGVGKTTVSAAYAVHAARQHPRERILLLSTDPAHSLSDILQQELLDRPARVALSRSGSFDAWQINSEKLFAGFLAEHKQSILQILDAGSIFSREDIEPLLETALPGMAEVSALLAIESALASGKYSRIVVDTAPFGHTLRLFGLPENFLSFLNFLEFAASRDRILAAHFGGHTRQANKFVFIDEWRKLVEAVHSAVADQSELFLVTTPGKFSLNESVRCRDILATYSPPVQVSQIVLNRSVRKADNCKVCGEQARATRQAQMFLAKHFGGLPVHLGEDIGSSVVGIAALLSFGNHIFGGGEPKWRAPGKKIIPLRLSKVEWPTLQSPITFVLGKGGVGKTTISAALGYNTRKTKNQPVQICSVDPAPSLDDIFQQVVGNDPVSVIGDPHFRASEMDSVAMFAGWVREITSDIERATGAEVSGIHVDLSFERQLLSKLLELVPPGIDEVLAIFRVLDLLADGSEKVAIDMAPTGHALELLRMPNRILAWTRPLLKTLAAHRTLAAARDAAVKIAQLGQRVRELANLLKDVDGTHIHVVLLPELLPDRETERLISVLKSLQLNPKSMFLNRVIFAKDIGNCPRCQLSLQSQQITMQGLKNKYPAVNIYAVRNFPGEIAGKAALKKFTGELWQLA